jgi:hypothetical protein
MNFSIRILAAMAIRLRAAGNAPATFLPEVIAVGWAWRTGQKSPVQMRAGSQSRWAFPVKILIDKAADGKSRPAAARHRSTNVSRRRDIRRPMWTGTREISIMRRIPFAVVAAALLATSPAWVRRPALPGDQFQLAAGEHTMTQTQHAVGYVIMGSVAKGEGWM